MYRDSLRVKRALECATRWRLPFNASNAVVAGDSDLTVRKYGGLRLNEYCVTVI